ncbi:MAG: alpha-N-acetylglucosaminidase, partial [Kiritimatiellae bacterium]|nr:alpha-N-acetylglucosaminidase [Kiritimatiellia bacterium]
KSVPSVKAAHDVIVRFAGKEAAKNVVLRKDLPKRDGGCDRFVYEVKGGKLTIHGSSPVALTRGFYSYVRDNGYGISSWSGNRCELPKTLPDSPQVNGESPFAHHYYFNVVTYGYTMAYWDWARWEKELDWMALHGYDMPLVLGATEAIMARVWKNLGFTDEEILASFVGPAHNPWARMGNISKLDSPVPASWLKGQIELEHKILKRARRLGMKPICPGFAGFVPEGFEKKFPDSKPFKTSWSGGAFHNWMLPVTDPLFKKIGGMYIKEWEKEFGKCDYYLVDSFNEMEVPFPPKGTQERKDMAAQYGELVYESIKEGNPDAVWTMQGWMFGYQRNIWDPDTLKALVSKVPDEKMLLLDLAVDYNVCFWRNGVNWDFYPGFFGKPWVYSVIPNMGGKTGFTGELEFYANGRLKAMESANRGKLAGYGAAPEGIENNEVIYELVSDGGWTKERIDLDKWLKNYTLCRYGKAPECVMEFWKLMRKSVYGSFTDHPRFSWQFRPPHGRGSIKSNGDFRAAAKELAKAAYELKGSPLYRADLANVTVQYLGALMEDAAEAGDAEKFERLALEADAIAFTHPNNRLEDWIKRARSWGKTDAEKNYYEKNARRLVTIWGPPVDDYSARIWSGLIRGYYLPRWKKHFEEKKGGAKANLAEWEKDWVENIRPLPAAKKEADPVSACLKALE